MHYIVGIDEVGRGPLAGPVTVCLVCCEENLYKKLKLNKNLPKTGLDSKKISEKNREKFSLLLRSLARAGKTFELNNTGISYVVSNISNKVIDSKGISFAIDFAISCGIEKLNLNSKKCTVLLDGGLKAPKHFNQKTIIKGDEKEKIIAWASILAKVERDELMKKFSKKYPKYGFDIHKGYGTRNHKELIKKHGLSKIHRKTWKH